MKLYFFAIFLCNNSTELVINRSQVSTSSESCIFKYGYPHTIMFLLFYLRFQIIHLVDKEKWMYETKFAVQIRPTHQS